MSYFSLEHEVTSEVALGSAPLPASAQKTNPVKPPAAAAAKPTSPAQPAAAAPPQQKESAVNDLLGLSTPAPAAVSAAPASSSGGGGLVDLFGLDTGPTPAANPVHAAALPPNASAPSIPALAQTVPAQGAAAAAPSNGQLLMEAAKEAAPAAAASTGPKSNTDIMALFDNFVSPPAPAAAAPAAQPPQMGMSMGGQQTAFGQPAFGQLPAQSQPAFGGQSQAAFGQPSQPAFGQPQSQMMGGLGGASMFPSPTQPMAPPANSAGGGFPNLMSGAGGFPASQPAFGGVQSQPAFGGLPAQSQAPPSFPAQFPPMGNPPPPGSQNAFASLTPQLAGLNFGGPSQPTNPTPAGQPSSFAANLWN